MRNERIHYVAVGVFVLAMLVAGLASIAVLSGRTGATDRYYTVYQDATGLKFGSQVLYMGFPVGQVEAVIPEPAAEGVRFRVRMAISRDLRGWGVPVDSVAQIRASGLLAAVAIDIRAGGADQALAPGDEIRGLGRVDIFGAVSDTANTLLELTESSVKPLLLGLNRQVELLGELLERDAGPLFANLGRLTGTLVDEAPALVAAFLAVADEVNETSRNLRVFLDPEGAEAVGTTFANLAQASEHLRELTVETREHLQGLIGPEVAGQVRVGVDRLIIASGEGMELVRDARDGLAAVLSAEHLERLDRILAQVDDAAGALAASAARVREQIDGFVGPQRTAEVEAALADGRRAAASLAALMEELRGGANALLGPDTVARLETTLDNVAGASANVAILSRELNERLGEILTPETTTRILGVLDAFSVAASEVAVLTRGLNATRGELDRLLGSLDGLVDENRPELRRSVADLRHTLSTLSRHVDAVSQNLEGTSRNMYEFSRHLRQNPGILLRGTRPADGSVPGG